MNGGPSQFARVLATLPYDSPLADRLWENMSFEEAMALPIVDPVAASAFSRSRAYGELLEGSLARTDDMLTRVECCGVAKVFCTCTVGEDIFGDGK